MTAYLRLFRIPLLITFAVATGALWAQTPTATPEPTSPGTPSVPGTPGTPTAPTPPGNPVTEISTPVVTTTEPPFYSTQVADALPHGVTVATSIDLARLDPALLTFPFPPVPVQPGSDLTLSIAADAWTTVTDISWRKNGETIDGENGHQLSLGSVAPEDTGTYQAVVTGDGEPATTVQAHIVVRPASKHPLVNLSTRARITPDSPQLTVGFVVPDRLASSTPLPKGLLLRAIGPGLAGMGVLHPLADPTVTVYDADGNDVTPNYAFAQVIYDDGSTPRSRYYQRVADAAASVGAFPVPVPTPTNPTVPDYAELIALPAGAYTVVVESEHGLSGDVLVEFYEVGL